MSYYDKISDGYSELHGEEQLKKAKIIASKINAKAEERLLDVGCGDGAYLYLFNCKLAGLDPSKELIAKYKGNHKLIIGRAEEIPFKDEIFDIVISITAIHNFTDVEIGLKEMRRVGKNKFAFSILKKSPKAEWIEHMIDKYFKIDEVIEENHDLIFFCTKKH